jgi:predicted O-methyltransferase YrrM
MLSMNARALFIRLAKSLYFHTPLWRHYPPAVKFDMTARQLDFITRALASIKADGAAVEIGVGGGGTSVTICRFMRDRAIKRQFYAIDTFAGFTKEDAEYEREKRGKRDPYLAYRTNSQDWYAKTLIANGIDDAYIIRSDAKQVDYSQFAPLAFCLVDVDLYQPVAFVLPPLYAALAPGGVIIVDDCAEEESLYDGAGEAYREFCGKIGIAPELAEDKLGVIRKPKLARPAA